MILVTLSSLHSQSSLSSLTFTFRYILFTLVISAIYISKSQNSVCVCTRLVITFSFFLTQNYLCIVPDLLVCVPVVASPTSLYYIINFFCQLICFCYLHFVTLTIHYRIFKVLINISAFGGVLTFFNVFCWHLCKSFSLRTCLARSFIVKLKK